MLAYGTVRWVLILTPAGLVERSDRLSGYYILADSNDWRLRLVEPYPPLGARVRAVSENLLDLPAQACATPLVIDLASGRLEIRVARATLPLATLLGFASRQNPQRGFLFVSRVLGKHLPCAPAAMRDTYDRLARPLFDLAGPVLIIGLAETATGLGGGVADSLARLTGRRDILFQHSTRHPLKTSASPLYFDEAHSHAPVHLLYPPDPRLARHYHAAQTLVLVDDEITSGRTLCRLASQLATRLPALRTLVLASLVNWLSVAARAHIAQDVGRAVRFFSLLDGEFCFTPAPDFQPRQPANLAPCRRAPQPARADTGRRALLMPLCLDQVAASLADTLPRGQPLRLIGTGEFAYPPFLIAETLAAAGIPVTLQSSTRSPVLLGAAIAASLACNDEHAEGVANFLHNPPPANTLNLVAYEAAWQIANHDLPAQLNARTWALPASGRWMSPAE